MVWICSFLPPLWSIQRSARYPYPTTPYKKKHRNPNVDILCIPYLTLVLFLSHCHKQLAQTIAEGGEEATGDDAHRDDVTALMVAAQGGHEAVVRLLVEKGGDVRAKDEEGFTPLLNAVKVGGLIRC